jgi:hypothetical protein
MEGSRGEGRGNILTQSKSPIRFILLLAMLSNMDNGDCTPSKPSMGLENSGAVALLMPGPVLRFEPAFAASEPRLGTPYVMPIEVCPNAADGLDVAPP